MMDKNEVNVAFEILLERRKPLDIENGKFKKFLIS